MCYGGGRWQGLSGRRHGSTLPSLHNINLDVGFVMRNVSMLVNKQQSFHFKRVSYSARWQPQLLPSDA